MRAFVRSHADECECFKNFINSILYKTSSVSVFYSQDKISLIVSSPKVTVECRSQISNMEISGRGWCNSSTNSHKKVGKKNDFVPQIYRKGKENQAKRFTRKSRKKYWWNREIEYYHCMRLSYQIPLITAITLIATLLVNIVTFEVALQTLFPKYTERVAQENPNTNV